MTSALLLAFLGTAFAQNERVFCSPDGKLKVTVNNTKATGSLTEMFAKAKEGGR